MQNIAVVGAQWGDEGKGKIVDFLSEQENIDFVARYQGGNNAGHTVVVNGEKHALHLLPSGILYPKKTCVVGNNVIINPKVMVEELKQLEKSTKTHAKLIISHKAHLIMPWHMIRDGIAGGKIGTTKRGIGPTYMDFTGRSGIRIIDTKTKKRFSQRVKEELAWNKKLINLMIENQENSKQIRKKMNLEEQLNLDRIISNYWQWLQELKDNPLVEIGRISQVLNQAQKENKKILFEGAQATLLDIAHGTYPYVTSSNPTVGGLYTGTGFRPKNLKVYGVVKAYTTRVGKGPFPTELTNQQGEKLRKAGNEFGTTTGRPRRCGWLDLTIVKYAQQINGLDALAVPKLDILTGIDPLKVAVGYKINGQKTDVFTVDAEELKQVEVVYKELPGWEEDITKIRTYNNLPANAKNYLQLIEETAATPVELIGVGPNRAETISR
jgi:adenylosuccinate synthase